MLDSPKISVVMATHNRAAVVGRAIESLLHQSYDDFELMIVDDGSSDETPEVLQSFAARDQRIVLHKQTNKGMASARNMGARQARGQYVAFMDDDDFSAPSRLARQLDFLEKHPEHSACTCVLTHIDKEGRLLDIRPGKKFEVLLNQDLHSKRYISKANPLHEQHMLPIILDCSLMITRQCFMTCGGYRETNKVIEDLDFSFMFYEKGYRVAELRDFLMFYRNPSTQDSLISQETQRYIKRHVVTYISGWYRFCQKTDPVNGQHSVDELHQLIYKIPLQFRLEIYKSLEFMIPVLCAQNGVSKKKLGVIWHIWRVGPIHASFFTKPFIVLKRGIVWSVLTRKLKQFSTRRS